MKAAVVSSPDAVPQYADFPDPVVEDGFEGVQLVAAGIHPIVRALAAGHHYGSDNTWPRIAGVDAVARTADGTLILTGFVKPPYGTLAEKMAVPAMVRTPLPDGADPVKVAGGMNPGLSSWMPLKARVAEIDALGTVLILGVTGVAGTLAVQNAQLLGATQVIGVGRNPDGLARANQFGAKTVALTGDRDSDAAALMGAMGREAPSIVLDFIWAGAAEMAFAALGKRGLEEERADIAYVQIGAMAGPNAAVPASLLRSRRIRIYGSGAGSASIAAVIAEVPRYMQRIAEHEVDVPTQTFPLSSIAQAWNAPANGVRTVIVSE